MATEKRAVPAYLDKVGSEKLEAIAANWGCSMSAAINRLIRDYNTENNEQSTKCNDRRDA